MFNGFQTASGKNVRVSEKALLKAKKLFEGIESDPAEKTENCPTPAVQPSPTPTVVSTPPGSGHGIKKPFGETLENYSSRHLKLEQTYVQSVPSLTTEHGIKKPFGFQTASGKNVRVSEKALLKAKKLFESIESDPAEKTENCPTPAVQPSPTVVFTPLGSGHGIKKPYGDTLENSSSRDLKLEQIDVQSVPSLTTEHGIKKPFGETLGKSSGSGRNLMLEQTNVQSVPMLTLDPEPQNIRIISLAQLTDSPTQIDEDSLPSQSPTTVPKSPFPGQAYGVKKPLEEISDTEDEEVLEPAEKRLKLDEDDVDEEMNTPKEDSQHESFHQEVLESTFALLADEEEDEGNRNSIFGDSDPIPLGHVTQSGGKIPLLHVIILRVYPITFMSKNDQGRNVFESDKSFKKYQKQREEARQSRMEKLYIEAKDEVEMAELSAQNNFSAHSRSFSKELLEEMPVEELLQLIQSLGEESFVLELLSAQKIRKLEEAKFRENEAIQLKIQSAFQSKVDSMKDTVPVPMLKVRIMDAKDGFTNPIPQNVLLSIWKPDEELQNHLTEAGTFQIKHLTPTVNSLELRLNSTRNTQIRPLVTSPQIKSQFARLQRKYSSLSQVLEPNFSPLFGEFDTVGIIVQISDLGPNSGVTVYLADANLNIISIRLWTSIADQGLDTELRLMNFVACQNLQWRATASPKCLIPCAFVQETTLFSLRTNVALLKTELNCLRENVKDVKRFMESCQMKVSEMLNQKGTNEASPSRSGRRLIATSPQLLRFR